jgi:polyhydroxybutyrate depolymerase
VNRRLSLALGAAIFLAGPARAHEQLVVDAGRGPITVYFPDAYEPESPLPVVLLLHGYSSSGAAVESWLDLLALVDSRQFIYAHPDGTQDFFGFRFWNATDACCNIFGLPVDDSQYLSDLLDEIELVLAVDPRRVHFMGHSNGGFMSHRMACDHAGRVASIASLAGAAWNDPANCAPASPVHALQIHGTQDNTIQYNGGTLFGNAYPSAEHSAEQWAATAGCLLGGLFFPGALDLVATIAGAETDVVLYQQACAPGGSGELWTMVGAPHSPSFTAAFSPAAIDWLLAHPKLAAPVSYCTAGTTASGCAALLGWSGTPSLSSASGFAVSASGVEGAKDGLFFYGLDGPQANPWGNGTSMQCVVPPVIRAPLETGTGTPGACNGSFWRDFNAFWSTAAPSKLPEVGGSAWMQLWFRDPANTSNQTTSLSDALEIEVGP